MTSACPVNKMTVSGADVACHVAADVSLTQPMTRSTGSNPTRSTVNRVNDQSDPVQRVNGSTRPGQRVNPDQTQPTLFPRAATRLHTHRPFWWRVRAREMEFWGNFGTYRFVLKFPTIWYIDLAYLKLLQT